jgi:hypothetical protein
VLRVAALNEGHVGKITGLRRSQRVCLTVAIDIVLQKAGSKATPEITKTLVVSAHGALILLITPCAAGEFLTLRNIHTQEQISCRVVDSNAGNTGVPEVAVEFLKPQQNFWHIAFPPSDWTPRGAESKLYGPQVLAHIAKIGPGKP